MVHVMCNKYATELHLLQTWALQSGLRKSRKVDNTDDYNEASMCIFNEEIHIHHVFIEISCVKWVEV